MESSTYERISDLVDIKDTTGLKTIIEAEVQRTRKLDVVLDFYKKLSWQRVRPAPELENFWKDVDIDWSLPTGPDNQPLIIYAARSFLGPLAFEILLENPLVQLNALDAEQNSALHHLIRFKQEAEVRLLLEDGTFEHLNTANVSGVTPLMSAVTNELPEYVKQILVAGGPDLDVNKLDKYCHTAFSMACYGGQEMCMRMIARHPKFRLRIAYDQGLDQFIRMANDDIKIWYCFFSLPGINPRITFTPPGSTIPHMVAYYGNLTAMDALLKHPGIRLDTADDRGFFPIELAANAGAKMVRLVASGDNREEPQPSEAWKKRNTRADTAAHKMVESFYARGVTESPNKEPAAAAAGPKSKKFKSTRRL